MTTFEEAASLTRLDGAHWSATFPPDWAQGRTMFGGLQAAFATTVAQQLAGPDRPLRTLDLGFVAPMAPGPVQVEAEVLGSGRSATQLQVSLRQDGVLGCRAYVVAGTERESAVRVPGQPPEAPPGSPEDAGVEFTVPRGRHAGLHAAHGDALVR